MKNEKIAQVLKQYRKQNDLSVKEVAYSLNDRYSLKVAEKTIYGWESGQAQPDADTLLLLCDLYKIKDILSEFGYVEEIETPIRLTAFETRLIKNYREHPEMQDAVKKLLGLEEED